jgi:biotin transporter BioY
MELAGLVGAVAGFVFGWVEYKVLSSVVIMALRRTDRSQTEAERADYARRIRLLQAIMLVLLVGGTPVLGYWIGRTAFG